MTVRVSVDSTRCQSHGQCCHYVPDVFELPASGPVQVIDPSPSASLLDALRDAEDSCPVQAITVSTTD